MPPLTHPFFWLGARQCPSAQWAEGAAARGVLALLLLLPLAGCWPRTARYAEDPMQPSAPAMAWPSGSGGWPSEPPLAEVEESRLRAFIVVHNPYLSPSVVALEAAAICREAQRHGVAVSLLAGLIATESSFNPKATSPVGAQGLGQLMPPTAKDMGVQDAYDPEQNIAGTAKYLAWLGHWWKADERRWALSLASYLAGVGTVQGQLRRGAGPTGEQKAYVARVANFAARLARP